MMKGSNRDFSGAVRQNIRMEWQHSMLQIMRRQLMHWEKVVRMDEQYDSGAALLNLGIAYMRSGDNENAKTYFNRVAELFPGTENEATAKSNLNSMSDTAADDTKTADDTQE